MIGLKQILQSCSKWWPLDFNYTIRLVNILMCDDGVTYYTDRLALKLNLFTKFSSKFHLKARKKRKHKRLFVIIFHLANIQHRDLEFFIWTQSPHDFFQLFHIPFIAFINTSLYLIFTVFWFFQPLSDENNFSLNLIKFIFKAVFFAPFYHKSKYFLWSHAFA